MFTKPQQIRAARSLVDRHLARAKVLDATRKRHRRSFRARLDAHFPTLCERFASLYGEREDCLDELVELVLLAARSWTERPLSLKRRDAEREAEPHWFRAKGMLGGVCYVDRYAGDLDGIRAQIPYFRSLGLTWLHLMPPFRTPPGRADGGYAVSSYREIDPRLGTMEDLRKLASALREAGIALVLDFVLNHTADDHEWAKAALAGDPAFERFYRIYPDRNLPDAYEQTTREIFPDDHPGSFVPLPDGRWVWATFHRFQWDLRYDEPAVFRAMAGEMLFLANQGVDVLRMDAVAFLWKRLGTPSENLPEAHVVLRTLNALCRIAAPSVLFLSEAIVHPDDVASYVDPAECAISYNPLLMALGWEALATRDVRMLDRAIARRQALPPGCAWLNYVRSHDDVGWTFADEDALALGIDPDGHRRFLNRFYVNRFEGSFARGVPFQDNPRTGDCRIAGTTASLAGVEAGDPGGVERVLLLHSLAFAADGIPLLYLGDEVGQLNDYGYLDDPATAPDSRLVHRPRRPEALYAASHDPDHDTGRIHAGLQRLITLRQATRVLAHGATRSFDTGNRHVLGFQRLADEDGVLVLANFADQPATLEAARFSALPAALRNLVSDETLDLGAGLTLQPRQYVWLALGSQPDTAGA